MIIVCGDSHTATHGAFGALAFGIGTSEVEHVLATQTLVQGMAKSMRITTDGTLPFGVTSKDLVMHIIGVIGTAGGTGHVVEYAGEAIRSLSMVCWAPLQPLVPQFSVAWNQLRASFTLKCNSFILWPR